jgi:hypothetical protein
MSLYHVLILDPTDSVISSTPFVVREDAFEYARYMSDQEVGRVQVRENAIISREVWSA